MEEAEIWILHGNRQILLTNIPGPVVDAVLFGRYKLPTDTFGWGEAQDIAIAEAKRLGYEMEYEVFA